MDGETPSLKLYDVNETEDVAFIEKSARLEQQDEDILRSFLLFASLLYLIPIVGRLIPISSLSVVAVNWLQALLLIPVIPLLFPVSRMLARRLLLSRSKDGKDGYFISIGGSVHGSALVAGDTNTAVVHVPDAEG